MPTVCAPHAPTVVYRSAGVADLPALVQLGQAFRAALYADWLADNPQQMETLAHRLVTGGPDSLVVVAEEEGRVIGMIGAVTYAHHLSGERVAGEIFWFVDPAARGRVGLRLLHQAEAWARARGALRFELIAPTPRAETLYARLGYAPVERTFQRRLA